MRTSSSENNIQLRALTFFRARNRRLESVLHYAALGGNVSIVQMLLEGRIERGEDINQRAGVPQILRSI